MNRLSKRILFLTLLFLSFYSHCLRAQLRVGIARINVTDARPGVFVNDSLYVRAMVLDDGHTRGVLVTVDAVSLGEIGYIPNDYLSKVRQGIHEKLRIPPENILINASHCHGIVRNDVDKLTIQAIEMASKNLTPVRISAGKGQETRIMENRRLRLSNGREADVRHRYSLPPDHQVVGVGPVDPEIGIISFEKEDGSPLAVLYNFACHPIQGVFSEGRRDNTADFPGFASAVLEQTLGNDMLAFFLQGCAGDVNPIRYKDVTTPRSAEPLGQMLGASTLKALKNMHKQPSASIHILNETIALPRANLAPAIDSLKKRQQYLIETLEGTSLDLKSFVQLYLQQKLSGDYPAAHAFNYLHEDAMNQSELRRFDKENKAKVEAYLQNIYKMEELTRIKENLALLTKHHATNLAAGKPTIDVEIFALRIGNAVIVSFPGELSVQIGLNIKKRSPFPNTFVTGCSNGYIYYAPTDEQLKNRGGAQEDSECLLAIGWQKVYEEAVAEILNKL
jgi:hypothetical protein